MHVRRKIGPQKCHGNIWTDLKYPVEVILWPVEVLPGKNIFDHEHTRKFTRQWFSFGEGQFRSPKYPPKNWNISIEKGKDDKGNAQNNTGDVLNKRGYFEVINAKGKEGGIFLAMKHDGTTSSSQNEDFYPPPTARKNSWLEFV